MSILGCHSYYKARFSSDDSKQKLLTSYSQPLLKPQIADNCPDLATGELSIRARSHSCSVGSLAPASH
jgi:hypothetical protein